jgi:hypothetical protein
MRLRCYDAIPLPPVSASVPAPSQAQPLAGVPTEPPSTATAGQVAASTTPPTPNGYGTQPLPPGTTPSATVASCKDDWRSCKDNGDLINNHTNWLDVQVACKEEVNREIKYGTPVWPGFWSGGAFGSYHSGTDYVTSGIAIAIEPDVQIQNGFGAMVHSTAYCTYNLGTKTVANVSVSAN